MHRGREMRKAMQAIVVAFRGGCAPEDPRPKGVGLFRSTSASEIGQFIVNVFTIQDTSGPNVSDSSLAGRVV